MVRTSNPSSSAPCWGWLRVLRPDMQFSTGCSAHMMANSELLRVSFPTRAASSVSSENRPESSRKGATARPASERQCGYRPRVASS